MVLWNIRIYLIFDLINVNDTESLHMFNFTNSTAVYKNLYCFISIKFGVEKKRIICRNFVVGVIKFLVGILILIVFFLSRALSIHYLWQGEIIVFQVLVPIKVVLVKNDYFRHPKFESHFSKWMDFCTGAAFIEKKYGIYLSHELIARLIATWIWSDLLKVIDFWSSNHQLSYFF